MLNASPVLRVLSWNIHKGFTAGNRAFVLEHVRHALRDSRANIVCLQEVVGENRRQASRRHNWIAEAQFEFLADQVWHHHAYGRNAVYPHGHHGNAILSDWPLVHTRNHNISVMPLSQRGVLHAVTAQGLHVLCAHFGLVAWERRRQLAQLLALLAQLPAEAPLVLAGDFNDWQAATHRRLCEAGLREVLAGDGAPVATFPARWPVLSMDRIYFRGLQLHTAQRLDAGDWRVLSDHCPLVASFHWP